MVVGQKIALGRVHAGKTVTIDVSDTQLAIHCDDGIRTVRRTTEQAICLPQAKRMRWTVTGVRHAALNSQIAVRQGIAGGRQTNRGRGQGWRCAMRTAPGTLWSRSSSI